MNLYLAASLAHEKKYADLRPLINNRLASYALTSQKLMDFYKKELYKEGCRTILDSGAFSVWTKGKELVLDDYAEYCLSNLNFVDYFVNLDVIPGKPFKKITAAHIKTAAAEGWLNYMRIIKKVPVEKVIHVFHQGEDFKWLERLVKKAPYIGLSPANDRTTEQRSLWLDNCMNYVLDDRGFPKVKFHGFAVTSSRLIARYPWYSVDSATWIRRSSFGDIFIPVFVNGKPDYSKTQEMVSFTERSVIRNGKKNHYHYTYLPKRKREAVDEWVKELGHTPQELHDDYFVRLKCNVLFYKKLESTLPQWPWAYKTTKRGLIQL